MEKHKKYNALMAFLVFAIAFVGYLPIVAPTVSFWDCGEYIAATGSLGIPHPPGNPLLILLGRVSIIILPFVHDIGSRVALMVSFFTALAGMFIYLGTVRAMSCIVGAPDNFRSRIITYTSGFVAGLLTVFSYTFMFNGVEASETDPVLLVVAINTWIILKWYQSREKNRDRYLLLFSYLSFLGIAIHMTSMLPLIPIFFFVILADREKLKDYRFWIVTLAAGVVVYDLSWFLVCAPLAALFALAMSFKAGPNKAKWRFAFFIGFFAIMGYSSQFWLPIRSELNPVLDEGHPVVTWDGSKSIAENTQAFRDYLARKQYGDESMVKRAFLRRGTWENQLGVEGHIGYGGFHMTQLFHFGKSIDTDRNEPLLKSYGFGGGMLRLFIYLLPTALMFFAWFYFWKRDKFVAGLLILLFIEMSIGLVFYMNFADGSMYGKIDGAHREVRIRDYFYTPAFMYFTMWLGIGAGIVMNILFGSKNPIVRKLAPLAVVLFLASPVLAYTQNAPANDRSHDFIPFDYAYNLLMSCEKDGILFTNGDNDTFPLWALQETYGIRKDVRIINLSLANTDWYVKQMKNLEPRVPISFTDEEIATRLVHQRNPLPSAVAYRMPNAGITVMLPGKDQQPVLRIQDQLVVNVVDANKWQRPIYFALTVSNDNFMGLDPYLKMQGLVYRVMPKAVGQQDQIDTARTAYLLDKVYRFRSLGDGSLLLSETNTMLMRNYGAVFMQMAFNERPLLSSLKDEIDGIQRFLADPLTARDAIKRADSQEALKQKQAEFDNRLAHVNSWLNRCVSMMPWDWRPRMVREDFLFSMGLIDEASVRIDQALSIEPSNAEYLKFKAKILDAQGNRAQVSTILRQLSEKNPDDWDLFYSMATNFEKMGMIDSAISVMQVFERSHPGERRAAMMIERFGSLRNNPASSAVNVQKPILPPKKS